MNQTGLPSGIVTGVLFYALFALIIMAIRKYCCSLALMCSYKSSYLRLTFSLAFKHAQPDAVIFLGDLMDEGNRADNDEFKRYVDRFFSIFAPGQDTKVIKCISVFQVVCSNAFFTNYIKRNLLI